MRTFAVAFIGGIVGTVFTSMIVIAWTGPASAPPNGNVAAPLNVGTTDQIKDGGLGLNALAVFGNAILSGTSRYLNFGDSAGKNGYGIRDNAGTIEFKNSGAAWASFLPNTGVQSISFADGTTQTTSAAPAPCASGFVTIESSGRRIGCIETAEHGSATYLAATDACFGLGGRLPYFAEFVVARSNYSLSNIDADFEWVAGAGGGTNDCATVDDNLNMSNPMSDTSCTSSRPYRCFVP